MRIEIIDKWHFKLVASHDEEVEYANHTRVMVDDTSTFVCSSEPSSAAHIITRPLGGTLFNTPLDISMSAFTTEGLLIVYVEMDDATYPFVLPCYDNVELMKLVAKQCGIICDRWESCDFDCSTAITIIFYYGFRLSVAVLDLKTAIKFWNKIHVGCGKPRKKCGCNG